MSSFAIAPSGDFPTTSSTFTNRPTNITTPLLSVDHSNSELGNSGSMVPRAPIVCLPTSYVSGLILTWRATRMSCCISVSGSVHLKIGFRDKKCIFIFTLSSNVTILISNIFSLAYVLTCMLEHKLGTRNI